LFFNIHSQERRDELKRLNQDLHIDFILVFNILSEQSRDKVHKEAQPGSSEPSYLFSIFSLKRILANTGQFCTAPIINIFLQSIGLEGKVSQDF